MRLYRAQFLSMILMIALGIGVFVGFNMEWYSIERNMFDFFEETGYADYRLISETGFSEAELEKIGQIAGVQEAARYLTVTADVAEREGDSVALAVTTNPAVSGVLVTDGEDYDGQNSRPHQGRGIYGQRARQQPAYAGLQDLWLCLYRAGVL